MSKHYVCHISGQGEKWELDADAPCKYETEDEWCVKAKGRAVRHFLPKSEYHLCEPPEVWRDCTEECTVNEHGSIQHNGVNAMVESGYRRRKVPVVQVDHIETRSIAIPYAVQWAFIVEKKVSE